MTHSTFAERFAYARTLRLVRTGDYPSKAEIGRAVDRTGQAVGPWEELDEPPTDWRVHGPLAAYLGVPERWLIRGEGEAPRPELWAAWLSERRGDRAALEAMKDAQRRPMPPPEPEPEMPAGFEDYAGEDVTPRTEPPRKAANDRGKGKRRG